MKIHGKVVQGLGLGTKLGYPTANLKLSFIQRCRTKLSFDRLRGVYAARATVDGATYNAAAIVGARTAHSKPLVEVHLLDFRGDLRDKELTVDLLDKISEIQQFAEEESLFKKIAQDICKVRAICSRE